jgi:hypothetical protein
VITDDPAEISKIIGKWKRETQKEKGKGKRKNS